MTPHAPARPPEATGGDGSGGSTVEAAAQSKPRKRKKPRPPPQPPSSSMEEAAQSKPAKRKKKVASSSAPAGPATPSPPSGGDGTGSGDGQQLAAGDGQQQRGKARVVWSEELHNMFLKAYNILGEDAVPKKILALMNVDGITRENVASHLQKYRLSLKQEEKRIPEPDNEGELEASSSQTPLPTTPPQAQAQEPAPSSLHTTILPPQPQAPCFEALNVSQLQVGQHHGQQQLLQTPPDCFGINTTATDWLLGPGGIPMAQPTQQQRFAPPPEATAVAARRELFKEQQEAGRDANATARKAAEMANMMGYEEAEIPMAQLVMAITGGEDDGQEQAAAEMGMGARAEDGQGPPAEPEAAAMAAGPDEEGQGRGGEPAGAAAPAAGSLSPPGSSSIHGQYWKIDDAEVSWDFGFTWYKTG